MSELGIDRGNESIDRWHYKPEVIVMPTAAEVDLYAASVILAQVNTNLASVLTVPTGKSAQPIWELLRAAHHEAGADFSRATFFNLDEYYPLAANHPNSYASYMDTHFFNHVAVPAGHRHIPNSAAMDPTIEAARYDALLKNHTVDLAVLGIGPGDTCHIGFNEPGSTVDSRTRYVRLNPQTAAVNCQLFDNPNDMPEGAITQGIADILEAKKIILVAKGPAKAQGIRRTLQDPVGPAAPSTFLRLHPNVALIIDPEAASLLS